MATPPASVLFWMCTMFILPPTMALVANTAITAPSSEMSVLTMDRNWAPFCGWWRHVY